MNKRLVDKFQQIKTEHLNTLIVNTSKVILGPSVIRVFKKETKPELKSVLSTIKVDLLRHMSSQEEYKKWFIVELDKIAKVIEMTNPKKERASIYPGYKWGHATKILNLFVREIVENKRYFSDEEVKRIRQFLYVPIDSKIIDEMKNCGCDPGVSKIKEISEENQFFKIQEKLAYAAIEAQCPRIWFDDVWSTN